jgi:hypothetical protein
MVAFVPSFIAEAYAVLTKLQIVFCVLAGLGIIVFGIAMFSNVNVAHLPSWLAPVAWGSVGLMAVSCAGVVATLALDRDKPAGDDDREEELLPVEGPVPETEETTPDLATAEQTEMESIESIPTDFSELGNEETIEFSTLPSDE